MNKMDNVRFDSHDKLNRKDQAFKISCSFFYKTIIITLFSFRF